MVQLLFLFQVILSGGPRVQTVQTALRFRHPGLVTQQLSIFHGRSLFKIQLGFRPEELRQSGHRGV